MKQWTVLAALIGVWLMGCQKQQPMNVPQSVQQQLNRLPAGIDFVAYWNHDNIKKSKLTQSWFERLQRAILQNTDDAAYQLLKDVFAQIKIDELLVALDVHPGQQPSGYAIVTGVMHPDSFMIQLRVKNKDTQFSIEKVAIHEKPAYRMQANDGSYVLLMAGERQYYFGPETWIRRMAKGEPAPESATQDSILSRLLANVAFGDQMWILVNQPMQIGNVQASRRLTPQMQLIREAVQAAVLSVRLNDDVQFDSKIICDSAENSELLADLIRGGLAAAKLSVAGERELIDEINRIKVDAQQSRVWIHGRLTQRFFDRAEAFGRQMHFRGL